MFTWINYNALAYISAFSVVIPTIYLYKIRLQSVVLKLLFIYLALSLTTELTLMTLALAGVKNLFIIEIFKLAELLLVVLTFKFSDLFENRISRYFIILPFVGLCAACTGLWINWPGLFDGFAHSCIIFLSVWAFYRMFLINDYDTTETHGFFWFNTAFFIYFSASFFLFLFGNLIRSFEETAKVLWTVHLFVNMIFYMILTVGTWKQKAI